MTNNQNIDGCEFDAGCKYEGCGLGRCIYESPYDKDGCYPDNYYEDEGDNDMSTYGVDGELEIDEGDNDMSTNEDE